jgi:hypothetical protein
MSEAALAHAGATVEDAECNSIASIGLSRGCIAAIYLSCVFAMVLLERCVLAQRPRGERYEFVKKLGSGGNAFVCHALDKFSGTQQHRCRIQTFPAEPNRMERFV